MKLLEARHASRYRHIATLGLLACLAWAYAITYALAGQTIAGKVVGITDGDTLTLLDSNQTQYKIRLSGIDTPERGQPFGHVATENLSNMAFGQLAVADCRKQDKYGRWVCVVKVDGVDICLAQIKAGLAWHYKKYASEQTPEDQVLYARDEEEAKAAHRGLWKDVDAIPPWDWRKRK